MGLDTSLKMLSEATGVALVYNGKDITGEQGVTLNTGLIPIPATIKVVSWFSSVQDGVLIHVLGNLYLLAYVFPEIGTCNIILINGELVKDIEQLVLKNKTVPEIYSLLKRGAVRGYQYRFNAWLQIKLP